MSNIIKDEAMAIETVMNHIDGFDYIPVDEYQAHDEKISEIKKIVQNEKKESNILEDIAQRMDKLTEDLDKLDASESKVKRYIEQRKAIHEVKKILRDAGKYEKYDENELAEIGKLID